jgi:hypothetical protein
MIDDGCKCATRELKSPKKCTLDKIGDKDATLINKIKQKWNEKFKKHRVGLVDLKII